MPKKRKPYFKPDLEIVPLEYFSDDRFQKIQEILKPPSDFNLRKRLADAIRIYQGLGKVDNKKAINVSNEARKAREEINRQVREEAGRQAEKEAKAKGLKKNEIIAARKAAEAEAKKNRIRESNLDEVIIGIEQFMMVLNKHEDTFLELYDKDVKALDDMKKMIERLYFKGSVTRKEAPSEKRGPKYDHPLRVYCRELIRIYEDAKKVKVTVKWDAHGKGPYGDDFDFIMAGMELINKRIGRERVRTLMKETLLEIRRGYFAPSRRK